MPLTHPVPALAVDPGYLLWAPLGTADPTNTVVASVFSDDWTAVSGWVVLGSTEEGHEFEYSLSTDVIEDAEHLDPLRIVTTGREGKVSFALVDGKSSNLKRALNGGTLTTTGATTTTMTTYTPPTMGQEVRCILGWESEDHTERFIWYQCFQSGAVSIPRRKGTDKAIIPVEFSLETPSTGIPFKHVAAGAARGA